MEQMESSAQPGVPVPVRHEPGDADLTPAAIIAVMAALVGAIVLTLLFARTSGKEK